MMTEQATTGEIDMALVELSVAQVAVASLAQIESAAAQMERMAAAGQDVTDAAGRTATPATLREIASRLRLAAASRRTAPAPAAAPAPTIPADYPRFRAVNRNGTRNGFDKAVASLKRMGGRYDPATKTWAIKPETAAANADLLSMIAVRVEG